MNIGCGQETSCSAEAVTYSTKDLLINFPSEKRPPESWRSYTQNIWEDKDLSSAHQKPSKRCAMLVNCPSG